MFLNVVFSLSALLTVSGALMVVVTRNLIHSCVFLLMSLLGIVGLYVTLNADFVAATQLVVYVGGVIVLMLFAVMLTGGNNTKEVLSRFGFESLPLMGNVKTYFWGILSAITMMSVAGNLIYRVAQSSLASVLEQYKSSVDEIGTKLLTDHVLSFEISSILLLGALVGAAIIARPLGSKQLNEEK